MTDLPKQSRLRADEVSAELEIHRIERAVAAEEHRLDRQLEHLGEAEGAAKRDIEAELRREHWGLEPERPLAWEEHPPGPEA